MKKADLVQFMAKNSDKALTQDQADLAIKLFFDGVKHALKNGESVTLVGDMTIEPHARPGRKGRNPQTGAEIEIAPKMNVKVKTGKKLDEAVQGHDVNDFLKK